MRIDLLSLSLVMSFIPLLESFSYMGRRGVREGRIVVMRALHTFSDEKDRISKNRPYEKATTLPIRMPSVILVEPFLDRNIGTVSRCMLNYGFSDLRLVNPQCDHLSENARTLAVGSYEILENAKIYDTLAECISDMSYVFATTGRQRNVQHCIFNPEEAAQIALKVTTTSPSASTSNSLASVGMIFGREKNGLTKDEIVCANSIITIGSFEAFPVLNLGQSVNIVCYEIYKEFNKAMQDMKIVQTGNDDNFDERKASRGDIVSVVSRLERLLEKTPYFPHQLRRNNNKEDMTSLPIGEQRDIVFRGLRGIFYRATGLTHKETSMLHGMLSAVEKSIDAKGNKISTR